MNAIQVSLSSLVMFGSLFVAQPGFADHLRQAENITQTLHRETIEYVRWLRYHVPESELSPQLRQDARAVLTGVNNLQERMLFTAGTPGETRQLHEEVVRLDRLVDEVHHRVEGYVESVRHRNRFDDFEHRANRFDRRGVELRFGRRFAIGFPDQDDVHRYRHRDRRELDRLQDGLRGLASRLESVHRRLHEVDEAFHRD